MYVDYNKNEWQYFSYKRKNKAGMSFTKTSVNLKVLSSCYLYTVYIVLEPWIGCLKDGL